MRKALKAKDVEDTLSRYEKRFTVLRDDLRDWHMILEARKSEERDKREAESKRLQELKEILSWLSQDDVTKKHLEIMEKRTEGTGQWFINSDEYMDWKAGASEASILWCPGKRESYLPNLLLVVLTENQAGTGKSFMS